jgi:hypothetical protein
MPSRSNEIKSQPIGFWTGEAYRHIARAIRESLAAKDLTQPQWWMLNHVANGRWTRKALLNKLAPANANEQNLDLDRELDDLIERAWLAHDTTTQHLSLTALGEQGRQQTWDRNGATHRRMIAGVSDEQYEDCIRVLQRIVGNLGGDPSPH